MQTTITIKDEVVGGGGARAFSLDVLDERLTVRELIRARVYQEVEDHNAKGALQYQGLVRPRAEERLNAPKQHRPIHFEPQYQAATAAFEENRLLVLVDDRQVDGLEEQILLTTRSEVTFLKLVPLVGG